MRIWQEVVMFILGGLLYVGVEILYRGWSHPSMFFVGGLCVWLIGNLDRAAPGLPLLVQAFLGAGIITSLELISGLIVNVGLGMQVWDYSGQRFQFMGQICLKYTLLWIPASLGAALADDGLRRILFGVPIPHYRLI